MDKISDRVPLFPPDATGLVWSPLYPPGSDPAASQYVYTWGPRFEVPGLPVLNRKGETCIVLRRGAKNSALVQFSDGYRAVVSRNSLRKVPK